MKRVILYTSAESLSALASRDMQELVMLSKYAAKCCEVPEEEIAIKYDLVQSGDNQRPAFEALIEYCQNSADEIIVALPSMAKLSEDEQIAFDFVERLLCAGAKIFGRDDEFLSVCIKIALGNIEEYFEKEGFSLND